MLPDGNDMPLSASMANSDLFGQIGQLENIVGKAESNVTADKGNLPVNVNNNNAAEGAGTVRLAAPVMGNNDSNSAQLNEAKLVEPVVTSLSFSGPVDYRAQRESLAMETGDQPEAVPAQLSRFSINAARSSRLPR